MIANRRWIIGRMPQTDIPSQAERLGKSSPSCCLASDQPVQGANDAICSIAWVRLSKGIVLSMNERGKIGEVGAATNGRLWVIWNSYQFPGPRINRRVFGLCPVQV